MAQTDGEKELVLGNKQLVSFFFVVLALCGVFFALGYMIGRNSSKAGISSLEGTPPPTASDAPTGQRQRESEAPPRPAADTPLATPEPAPLVQTQAAREPVAAAAAPDTASPEPGATYLQVAAQRRSDATNLVKTLREQNLPVVLAESSKPDLFRVLVGPYHKTADVAEAKARLKSLGFANSFVLK
jgi:cell division septation protein DedD